MRIAIMAPGRQQIVEDVLALTGMTEAAGSVQHVLTQWIRTLLRSLAGEGRTVFVSFHLMSKMEPTADRLIVIGKGLRDRR